jgi:DNA-binding NarL/FixJ family response regulator
MSDRRSEAGIGGDRQRAKLLERPLPPAQTPAHSPQASAQEIEALLSPIEPDEAPLMSDEALLALLTPRQLEVLVLTARGLPGKQIGAELGCAAGTVYKHRRAITLRTGLRGQAEMTLFACRTGLVQP